MDEDVLRDYEFGATFAPKTLEVHNLIIHAVNNLVNTPC